MLKNINMQSHNNFANNYLFDQANVTLSDRDKKILHQINMMRYLQGNRYGSNIGGMLSLDTIDISQFAQHLLSEAQSGTARAIDQATAQIAEGERTERILAGKEDLKTGYPWIDNFMFRRDSTGPLTPYERAQLNSIKRAMSDRQGEFDCGWYRDSGLSRRVDPFEWGLIDEDGYPHSFVIESAKDAIAGRDRMNMEFNSVLQAKGITLTSEDKFSLTINFDNTVTVEGHPNKERGKEIESALNENNLDLNYSLVMHMRETMVRVAGDWTQNQGKEASKYTTSTYIAQYTGYSINQLTVRDDGVFTNDGKNIAELLKKGIVEHERSLNELPPEVIDGYANQCARHYVKRISSDSSLKNARDASFTIDYRNNSLCDVNTSLGVGVGQLDWYDKLLSLRGDCMKRDAYAISIGLWHFFDCSMDSSFKNEITQMAAEMK